MNVVLDGEEEDNQHLAPQSNCRKLLRFSASPRIGAIEIDTNTLTHVRTLTIDDGDVDDVEAEQLPADKDLLRTRQ